VSQNVQSVKLREAPFTQPAVITAALVGLLLLEAALRFGSLVGMGNAAVAILTILGGLAFLLAHGSQALGWRNIAAFLVITVVISFAAEAIGVATGLVFGPYHYTGQIGPKLLGVPPLIQAAYAAMGYASLMIGRVLLGVTGAPRHWKAILAVTLVGALIMVGWDVAMDPYQSTVSGIWIWHDGGPYFGVGIHNYLGWFVTVFSFMLVYHLYASRFQEQPDPSLSRSRFFWGQPPLFYAAIGLGTILPAWIGGFSLPYASPANYTGSLAALESSLALVAVFVMGTPVVTALLRLSRVAQSSDNSGDG
jgi:uncharacterized membrane protein